MHDVFSRAFNYGGYAAPESNMDNDDDDEDWSDQHYTPKKYKADFFACITSDGSAAVTQEDDNRQLLLDETGGPALLLGWLSQHHQFGVVTANKTLKQVTMHASCGPSILAHSQKTDWAYAQLIASHNYDEEPMVHYLHAVAAYNEARPLQNGPLLTGWCSWYHYYENISAGSLRENFSKLQALQKTVPTNVAVVDDGYMAAWGDWDSLKPGKFPQNGMKGVATDIESFGMRPGVWLAPFACDKHSQVAKRHPDWIIRNDQGRPANSSNCGKFFYGLDATNPHVREYVYSCVKRAVHEWGFNVLKIDFLYAACLEGNGKYDLSMTRAEAMHLALRTIRSAAGPDVFLIGCGCPIGTGIGYADGMRVSADTGPTWYPAFPLPWWDNGTLPALRAMTRNSMSRAILGHRWWHNDPDCLLLGETTRLTDTEVASAASIVALTCGMLLLSDDLTQVSPSRMNILTKIFPMTGATAVVLDLHNTVDGLPSLLRLWCTDRYYNEVAPMSSAKSATTISTLLGRQASFTPDRPPPHPTERKRNCVHVAKGLGTWTLLSISNWRDEDAVVSIPSVALEAPPTSGWEDDQPCTEEGVETSLCSKAPHGYHVFSFWSSAYTWMPEASTGTVDPHPSLTKRLKAHETEIFHLRPVTPDIPQYIGSDIHFSCGQEVQIFVAKANVVKVLLQSDLCRTGHIFLFVPRHDASRVKVSVNGKSISSFRAVGNTPGPNNTCIGRIVSIPVVVRGDGSKMDGEVVVTF
jgi:alpha-galactosidase